MLPSRVTYSERIARQGHPGLVVWFTGLSGAGKTTLATSLERQLFQKGCLVYLLDGDALRLGLCSELGFSIADRKENVRRTGAVARIFADAGFIVLVALISPFRQDRERIRTSLAQGQFVEVFVNAPLEICEKRDVKGLYQKARTGLISEFTGVSSPYEPPLKPELNLQTDRMSIKECLDKIHAHIVTRIAFVPSR